MNNLISYLLILSIFGPYVLPGFGIRTEQFVIYPVCVMAIVFRFRKARLPLDLIRPSVVWMVMLVTAAGMALSFGRPLTKLLAGADDYLLPLAALIVISSCAPDQRKPRSLAEFGMRICMAIQCCLLINVCIQVMEGLFPQVSSYLGYFWTGDIAPNQFAVGRYALDSHRLTGIFNQPMEHGVAYGVGLFCWLHRASLQPPKPRDYAMLAALLLGGVIGTSKVFLFGALPLFVISYGPSVGQSRGRVSRVLVTILAIASASLATWAYSDSIIRAWPGSDRIVEMFRRDNLMWGITAGRFDSGSDGVLRPLISEVYETSPVLGLGLGGMEVVDSAYVSAYMSAGMVGLVLYLVVLGLLLKAAMRGRAGRGAVWLGVATVVFIAGAGVGAPVLTLNRASTLMWCWLWVLATQSAMAARAYARNRPVLACAPQPDPYVSRLGQLVY